MTTTSNYKFKKIDFNDTPWSADQHDNWSIVDAVLARYIAISNMQGAWNNATAVTVGQKYVDTDGDTIWEVLVAHTTASSGTFAADRTANPSYWQGVTVDLQSVGAWAAGSSYGVNDFVTDTNRYGVVISAHTATTSYDTGVSDGDIVTLIDLSTDLAAAAASAANAATSEANAAASAAALNLPDPIAASEYLRGNGAGTAWEQRTAAETRTDLSLVVGTNVQAYDAGLLSIAGLTTAANKMIYATASDTYATADITAQARTLVGSADLNATRLLTAQRLALYNLAS